jgi:ketosteroid isomerase-like protein
MLVCLTRFSLFFVCVAVLFAVGGCQSIGNNIRASDAKNSTSDSQSEISSLLDQYIEALKHKDLPALDRIWADDLTFVNLYGDLLNKKNRMDNIKSGATAFNSIKLSDVNVRMYDEAAVATFKVAIDAHYSGLESSGNYRVTTVWAQPKGTWQLVAVHMTRME